MIHSYDDYGTQSEFRTDVLVIGTGAGGAVVGAELAQAGFEVTFAEEGGYHPTSSFSAYGRESLPRLYREGGATIIMGRPQIPYVEGRCVGGSTVINGGMTYRPPAEILEQWQDMTGEATLGPLEMEERFDRVERRIHAKTQLDVSIGDDSRIMVEGARRKGWKVIVNRRNQEKCVGANNCIFGCPTGAKQSTLVSYMPLAMAAGARCLTEVRIERLLIEGGRCVGAAGHAVNPVTRRLDREVVIRADRVVVACGAVQTPYLLLRHRLGRPSKQLGRNFLCHPNAKVLAFYPHEVRASEGVSQYAQIREFRDEGLLFAENFIPPTAMAAQLPFQGNDAWDLMSRYNSAIASAVLVEDSTTGRVSRPRLMSSMPYARYDITAYDHARFLRGVRLLAGMHLEMGADRVLLPFTNFHEVSSVDELDQIEVTQTRPDTLELFTVHLMGTARMGRHPHDSVVGLDGQMWDLPGCYVADASLFPTAIGVNPQVTIMALASLVADRIANAQRTPAQRAPSSARLSA